MANVIPQWKQALIDKKQKKHEEERRRLQEEEHRIRSMPQWKQAILAKRREHGAGGTFTVTPKTSSPPVSVNDTYNAQQSSSVQLSAVESNRNTTTDDKLVDSTSLLGSIKTNPWMVKEKGSNDIGDQKQGHRNSLDGFIEVVNHARQKPEVIVISKEEIENLKYVLPAGSTYQDGGVPQDESDNDPNSSNSVQNMRSKFETGKPHMRFSASFESSLAAKNASRSENREKRLSLDVLASMAEETPPYAVRSKSGVDDIVVDERPNLRPRSLSNSTSLDKIVPRQNDKKVVISATVVDTKQLVAPTRTWKQKQNLPEITATVQASKPARNITSEDSRKAPPAVSEVTGPADVNIPSTALLPSFLKGASVGAVRVATKSEPEKRQQTNTQPVTTKVTKNDSDQSGEGDGGKVKAKDATKNGILMKPTLARPKATPSTGAGQAANGVKTTVTQTSPKTTAPQPPSKTTTTPSSAAQTPLAKVVAEVKADGRTFIVKPRSAKKVPDNDDTTNTPAVSSTQFSFSRNGPSNRAETNRVIPIQTGSVPPLVIPREDDSEDVPITNIDDIDFDDEDPVPTKATTIKITTSQEPKGKHKKVSSVVVVGGNAPTKKSCLLKSNKRKKGLVIGFVKEEPEIYEYPSEACWSDDEPVIKHFPLRHVTTATAPALIKTIPAPLAVPELDPDDIDPPSYNTAIENKSLPSNDMSSYTPSHMEDAYKEEIKRRKEVKFDDDDLPQDYDSMTTAPSDDIDQFSTSGAALLF